MKSGFREAKDSPVEEVMQRSQMSNELNVWSLKSVYTIYSRSYFDTSDMYKIESVFKENLNFN